MIGCQYQRAGYVTKSIRWLGVNTSALVMTPYFIAYMRRDVNSRFGMLIALRLARYDGSARMITYDALNWSLLFYAARWNRRFWLDLLKQRAENSDALKPARYEVIGLPYPAIRPAVWPSHLFDPLTIVWFSQNFQDILLSINGASRQYGLDRPKKVQVTGVNGTEKRAYLAYFYELLPEFSSNHHQIGV